MHSHTHTTPNAEAAVRTTGNVIHWAPHYDSLVRVLTLGQDRTLRRRTLALAQIQPGENVLDVGCGTGDLTILARTQSGPAGTVCGIDAAPEMIDVARTKAAKAKATVDFRVAAIEQMPFSDATFDVVLSSLMMHHLPDSLKGPAFAEIQRVLKPGGRVVIVDMKRPSGHASHLLLGFMQHGALTSGVQDLAPWMQAAGLVRIETGGSVLGPIGCTCGWRD